MAFDGIACSLGSAQDSTLIRTNTPRKFIGLIIDHMYSGLNINSCVIVLSNDTFSDPVSCNDSSSQFRKFRKRELPCEGICQQGLIQAWAAGNLEVLFVPPQSVHLEINQS